MSENNIRFEKAWIPGLDSIRFVLALIVMLGHTNFTAPFLETFGNYKIVYIFKAFLGNAFVGPAAVIAFFIVSGIVIHFPYRQEKNLDLKKFLLKRYLRIGIPMIVVGFFAQLLFGTTSILPFWSLYCELIYYTIYPLILALIRSKKLSTKSLIAAAYIISYLLLLYSWDDFQIFFTQSKSLTNNFMWLGVGYTWLIGLPFWLLGVQLANNYETIRNKDVSIKKIYFVRTLVFLTAFICSVARFHLALSYTISLGFFAFVAVYWIASEIAFWKNRNPPEFLENGGKWSYSLYLCHPIAISFVSNYYDSINFRKLFIELFGALIISYMFFILVEKPSHLIAKRV